MTTGFDAIVGSRTLRPEVVLTTTRGIHGPQTSEMAFLYMLNLARDFPRMRDNQKRRIWKRWTLTRLYGKTVVITGLGQIAEALAPRCKAFGMTVVGVTRTPRPADGFDRMYRYAELEQAAALADFLIVLTPYSPEADNLIDARVLAAMKPSAFLINLARGGLCDEDADRIQASKIQRRHHDPTGLRDRHGPPRHRNHVRVIKSQRPDGVASNEPSCPRNEDLHRHGSTRQPGVDQNSGIPAESPAEKPNDARPYRR